MATVILVRHGRTTANAAGVMAGRSSGIKLDETGHEQAAHTADRLAALPLVGVVSSPLERCEQTAQAVLKRQAQTGDMLTDADLTECDYGTWQGRTLTELATEALWSQVQSHPSAVTFPDGESMAGMQARAVSAIRRHDATYDAKHGTGVVRVAVTRGDLVKPDVAGDSEMYVALVQRLNVGPASASIVHYGTSSLRVLAINTVAGDLSRRAPGLHTSEAPVGGGAGHQAS